MRDQAFQLACWSLHQIGHLFTATFDDIANALVVRSQPDCVDTLVARSEGAHLRRQLDKLLLRWFRALLLGDARGWCA
eukprot:13895880-Heterocapsa_arctica.AAC.1